MIILFGKWVVLLVYRPVYEAGIAYDQPLKTFTVKFGEKIAPPFALSHSNDSNI